MAIDSKNLEMGLKIAKGIRCPNHWPNIVEATKDSADDRHKIIAIKADNRNEGDHNQRYRPRNILKFCAGYPCLKMNH